MPPGRGTPVGAGRQASDRLPGPMDASTPAGSRRAGQSWPLSEATVEWREPQPGPGTVHSVTTACGSSTARRPPRGHVAMTCGDSSECQARLGAAGQDLLCGSRPRLQAAQHCPLQARAPGPGQPPGSPDRAPSPGTDGPGAPALPGAGFQGEPPHLLTASPWGSVPRPHPGTLWLGDLWLSQRHWWESVQGCEGCSVGTPAWP